MFMNYYFFFNFFFYSNNSFFFNYKYLMINLLSIEYMMLSLLMIFYLVFVFNNFDFLYLMIFLVFMVCESVLGLSMFISMIRSFGNNNLMNLFFFKY